MTVIKTSYLAQGYVSYLKIKLVFLTLVQYCDRGPNMIVGHFCTLKPYKGASRPSTGDVGNPTIDLIGYQVSLGYIQFHLKSLQYT